MLLITTGGSDWEGEESLLGVDIQWSQFDAPTYRRLIEEVGFQILEEGVHRGSLPGDDDWHPIFLARAK